METITCLDSNTINQIAAGEVVENASSVVKELVENALDAKASHIKIETISSGQGFVAVRDNGIGMSIRDMHLSLERHATSKIKNFNDLYSLKSLGFRGEALPSIASISKLKLISSDAKQLGYALFLEGGVLLQEGSYSRNRGTCVEVSTLFFNVPARKKFQKKPRSDFIRIRRLLENMLLTKNGIGWEWYNDGKVEIVLNETASYEERVKYVFGEDFFKNSLEVNFTQGEISLFGRAGNFEQHKSTRLHQKIFLNNRIIESPLLSKKIMECYGSMLPKDKFPSFVLNIQIPPSWSDVNVHPQKKEVRFLQEELILKTLEDCFIELFGYVRPNSLNPVFFLNKEDQIQDQKEFENKIFDFSDIKIEEQRNFQKENNFNSFDKIKEIKPCYFQRENFSNEQQLLFFKNKYNLLKNIPPFLLVEEGEELLLIHTINVRKHLFVLSVDNDNSKILFEKQFLLSPLILDFSFIEASVLLQYLNYFRMLCFEIDHFGQNSFSINAIPSILLEEEVVDCLSELVDELVISTKNGLLAQDFPIVLRKILKKVHFFKKDCPKVSLLLDCFWAIGRPNCSLDGTILCKSISLSDLNKWLNS